MVKATPAEFESGRDRFFDALEPIARSLGCQVTVTITPVGFYNEEDALAPRSVEEMATRARDGEAVLGTLQDGQPRPAFCLNEQVTMRVGHEWGTVIGVMHLLNEPPRFLVRYRGVGEVPYIEDWFFESGLISGWASEARQ